MPQEDLNCRSEARTTASKVLRIRDFRDRRNRVDYIYPWNPVRLQGVNILGQSINELALSSDDPQILFYTPASGKNQHLCVVREGSL